MGSARPALILIGYWRPPEGLPDPHAFVDPDWDTEERAEVADYLRRGFVARAFMGKASCRICGEPNGSLELSDGTFIWPEGLAHYVADHAVRLPQRFTDHVRERTQELKDAEGDDSLWREHT